MAQHIYTTSKHDISHSRNNVHNPKQSTKP